MAFLSRSADEGFDRLQTLLLGMRAGDVLLIDEAARVSGLSQDICRTALEALTRVGLMSHETDGRFVRRALDLRPH
jgi:predicted transcriptional regulator